ncbi:MAG: Asp-tRNA(Asn)/Glu-tRNA(Gln) amidotransferase subunit GatA [Candidatus Colwellbacteria bacterium]|jgi:aspartyl-tRNA(Asn)/glutamyl-tRNA(Gln) amidotransferase subunit A|nr:Asp-tRNA(Asn)/Glu-tRNA(Gln) amidotransferase subunit GatA [Candidatus Colwellbacteria bacterium]MCK9497296.1 Asp-tRNA(Asn)/Glu-tRNA(Gln) amidotransferase subunit GatA [Candidatus Colwellbacteria bacterium]MDD4818768.1 Asp-tRNA(Asn)/Glu-tRNA(Gln) amidotransferase subunit GatA [Candidatus Colwellbacteria bacterium]
MDKNILSIKDVRDGIVSGDFSAEEVTSEFLKEAKQKNQEINAYISIREEEAIASAKEIDEKIKAGEDAGPLCGAPLAIKDNLLIEDEVCTSASKLLKDYVSAYDATVIKKLRTAGAVFLGKANMDEFAMGSSTENSAFGPTKNPVDTERVPGGSSGGSAAAVAGRMALGAIGSDTGGSIRLPASFCGVVGMKPTYGRVSRFGLMAMASSLDQIGPFGKTVADAEEIYSVIKGADKHDATSRNAGESQLNLGDPSSITIGIPDEYFSGTGLDDETSKAMQETVDFFRSAGMKIKKINLPYSKYALSAYYIIIFAEISTNLARFDGIRYSRGSNNGSLFDIYMKTRGAGFGEEVKRRMLLGTFVLSAGYYDAYYAKAQKVRQLIKRDFIEAFNQVDVILSPTSPTVPFKFGEKSDDPVQMYLSDIFTVPVNLAGLPAISIPVKGRVDKLPIGFQLIGKHWHDSDLFSLGKYYEGQ